jgi:hypothetical protein
VIIVNKYAQIIENKRTDAVPWQEKKNAWENIGKKFNSQSYNNNRTTKMLQIKYEGLKRTLRKKKAKNSFETYRKNRWRFKYLKQY